MQPLKTGRKIMACVTFGEILSGAPEEQTARLTAFAAELGLLFQIKDDILDVVGETVELGKQAGTDARLDRHTYVSVYGLRESERLAAESREKALAELGQVRGETVDLAGITNYIYERRR